MADKGAAMEAKNNAADKKGSFLVTNVQRYSLNDGPGIRTTVFLKGCPLQCAWCHNPESINPYQEFLFNEDNCVKCGSCAKVCPEEAITPPVERKRVTAGPALVKPEPYITSKISGAVNQTQTAQEAEFLECEKIIEHSLPVFDRERCTNCLQCVDACRNGALYPAARQTSFDEVLGEVLSDEIFYETSGGGMTISGGEPLLQPEVTLELLRRAKEAGIHTVLDTSGFARWERIVKVLPYVDLVLFDVKMLDDEKHKKWTGISNRICFENLRKMVSKSVPVRLRCVIVHNANYWDLNYARDMVKFAGELGDSVVGIDIMPFHNFADKKYRNLDRKYFFSGFPNLYNDDVEEYRKVIEEGGPWEVTVGGMQG